MNEYGISLKDKKSIRKINSLFLNILLKLSFVKYISCLRAPIILFLLLMGMFTLERFAILAIFHKSFVDIPLPHLITGFMVGLRFDLVMTCTFMIFPAPLIIFINNLKYRRFCRKLGVMYSSLILSIVFFACAADFFFFYEFEERLNRKVLEYIQYDYVLKIIITEYPTILLLALTAVISVLSYKLLNKWYFVKKLEPLKNESLRERIFIFLLSVLWTSMFIGLMVLGIRGSTGPKAINSGPAYFSSSSSLSQLALNGLFTLREAAIDEIVRHKDTSDYFGSIPLNEAIDLTVQSIPNIHDKLLNDPNNPLRRITDTGIPVNNYNVVLVVMESMGWQYIGAMGGEKELTPNLNRLAKEGFLFDHCFAVGPRTTRGFSGIVCGFPDLPGKSVTTRSKSEGNFLTLASILKKRNYETMFIYGGQPMYDHRQSFLMSNGYDRFVSSDKFEQKTFRTHLGYCDENLFHQANREFVKMGDKPFLATLLTLSFHRDYNVPAENLPKSDPNEDFHDQKQCIRYCDWSIGNFIRQAQQEEYFSRTIFVFVADHSGGYLESPKTPASFRVPFLVYAPGIVESGSNSEVCSQTDIPPTIMSFLGGSYEHCFFGSSIPDRPVGKGKALLQFSGQLALIDSDRSGIIIKPGTQTTMFTIQGNGIFVPIEILDPLQQNRCEQLYRNAVALLQTGQFVVEKNSYNLQPVKK